MRCYCCKWMRCHCCFEKPIFESGDGRKIHGKGTARPISLETVAFWLSGLNLLNLSPPSRFCWIFFTSTEFILISIQVFVLLLSILVMLQQALGSGYLNSVISTIEKRYEIPSSVSGVLASMYGVGNVATILFVSYLGSQRHIPVFIGFGVLLMGLSSLLFALPHFIASPNAHPTAEGEIFVTQENICQKGEHESGFSSVDSLMRRSQTCLHQITSTIPVLFFALSQLLLGIGGSPLLTLGTAYIDNHVNK